MSTYDSVSEKLHTPCWLGFNISHRLFSICLQKNARLRRLA